MKTRSIRVMAAAVLGFGALAAAEWPRATPAEMGMDEARLVEARDYSLAGGGSGCVVRGGKLVFFWGDLEKLYDLKSTTKSIGVTALGLAIIDGKIGLHDTAIRHHPEFGVPPEANRQSGWLDRITIFHLATQTAGFAKPGGYTALGFAPGTRWAYSDGGPNWMAECITLAYKRDIQELMFDRVFTPIGITRADLRWRDNAYRPKEIGGIPRREFGSGVHANVAAMARIGYLYLRNGRFQNRQLIPKDFVEAARTTPPEVAGLPVVEPGEYGKASSHYGLLWWNNADGTLEGVPRDTYWSWGLYESLIIVIPSLDLVVSRAGASWPEKPGMAVHYGKLQPFLAAVTASVKDTTSHGRPPYPPSPVVAGITWADPSTIVRRADGSDNWPLTWADDGNLYTAYGDGWGFEPKLPLKLGMGFARITGSPENFAGINIRSPSGENRGQGGAGRKASGVLMVDGTLYMWARNAGNSQLAWSNDYAATWTWSDWKFTTSFGHPAFLNFGRNYSGARDSYVYSYSHDNDSAYEPANRMVMARVPKERIREQMAWEFFAGFDPSGRPRWTGEIDRREAVFVHSFNRCYRSSVSYNPALKRYFWCQIIPGEDTRFEGGFGIYDAPEPWGPWTTVYFTEKWDVGPGENGHLPTKWMSPDGTSMYLVFSGDDKFSLRKATLQLTRKP